MQVCGPVSPFSEPVIESAAARGSGQDRAHAFERDDGLWIVLADGAGGTGNGATAAQALVDVVGTAAPDTDWCTLLADLDLDAPRLGGGQSTAVILAITNAGITGASVGDSEAWLLTGPDIRELTAGQLRKPLVGDGCIPFRIDAPILAGSTLLVASDGLFRYARRTDIARIVAGHDLRTAAHALIDLVRLPTGALQDDISIVLCRHDS